jgi:serine/threonine protein kinase
VKTAGEEFDKRKEEEDKKALEVFNEDSVGPDHFKILAKLGQGSFGQVYLVEKYNIYENGEKVLTGNLFAMKILNKKQIMGQNLVKYAKTERDVLTYMTHPFIVGLKFSFQTPEKLFLLLDYAAGGNMSRALHKDKRFTEDRGRIYLAEILLALEFLHKKNIIYRDLKPDNIVFDSVGHALVTDFGLAKEGIADDSAAKSFCGSPAYLAPEMLKRSGHGQSVDWYLLGVLLYEMLVGIPPYYSNNKDQLYENI